MSGRFDSEARGMAEPVRRIGLRVRPGRRRALTVLGVTNDPKGLSGALRGSDGRLLRRRRVALALSYGAMGSLATTSLYQVGAIRHLPDLGLPGFDSDRVCSAPEAYALLGMPDGPLGVLSYATTAALAAAGPPDRARRQSWLPVALAAKATIDLLYAGKLAYDQVDKQGVLCLWCMTTVALTAATWPLTLPEARAALTRSG